VTETSSYLECQARNWRCHGCETTDYGEDAGHTTEICWTLLLACVQHYLLQIGAHQFPTTFAIWGQFTWHETV